MSVQSIPVTRPVIKKTLKSHETRESTDGAQTTQTENMSQPRVSLWATEEIDEELQVDVNLAIGNYGQNGLYDDGRAMDYFDQSIHNSLLRLTAQPRIDEATLIAVQQQMAQQAAFAQIPDAVKRVRITYEYMTRYPLLTSSQFIVHFHQAVLENNLAEITVAYESGWNRLTEKHYAKTEWPEAEVIAPLVNDGTLHFPRLFHPTFLFTNAYRPTFPHPLQRTILSTRIFSPTA